MNAPQLSRPPLQPETQRRVGRRTQHSRRSRPYKALAWETTAKIAVNITLSVAAVTALVQLLPYHFSVQAKLQDIRKEIKQTQSRVARLQSDFNQAFDPESAKAIIQKQTPLVDPTRRQIVFNDNDIDEESSSD